MSVLRSILAWALLLLVLAPMTLGLVVLRLGIADRTRRAALSRGLTERAVGLYLRCSPLYRLRLLGRQRLPAGACVLVANHESGIDAACLMALGMGPRFLAANWLFRAPLIGFVMRAGDHIAVSGVWRRSDPPVTAVDRAAAALADGEHVAVFPEGAYGASAAQGGEIGAFRRGAFIAARRSGAVIVPVRITGSGAAWRPGSWIVRGVHDLTVEVLAPVPSAVVEAQPPDAIAAQVRATIAGR